MSTINSCSPQKKGSVSILANISPSISSRKARKLYLITLARSTYASLMWNRYFYQLKQNHTPDPDHWKKITDNMLVQGRDGGMRFKVSLYSFDFFKSSGYMKSLSKTPSFYPVRGTGLIQVQPSRGTLGEAVWGCLEPSTVPTLCP